MTTRRQALRLLGAGSASGWLVAVQMSFGLAGARTAAAEAGGDTATLPLAPGAPTSPERMALIESFRKQVAGLDKQFEARKHNGDWAMPYRLFRPASKAKLPLVMYLHGDGGLGDDNEKQLNLGNIFGTRVWALPENQQRFPCCVVVPQTDRGWIRYHPSELQNGASKPIAGLGEGAQTALAIVDQLCREFAIDERRIYLTGQSMGGAGAWNMLAHRPGFFAAAAICCGSGQSADDGTGSIGTPLWNFHGEADHTVPVAVSRRFIAERRAAGGHPLYTEYPGVDHNVWQWAYTEPALLEWVFAQRRG